MAPNVQAEALRQLRSHTAHRYQDTKHVVTGSDDTAVRRGNELEPLHHVSLNENNIVPHVPAANEYLSFTRVDRQRYGY